MRTQKEIETELIEQNSARYCQGRVLCALRARAKTGHEKAYYGW